MRARPPLGTTPLFTSMCFLYIYINIQCTEWENLIENFFGSHTCAFNYVLYAVHTNRRHSKIKKEKTQGLINRLINY